jgi:uncharacterized membrane protein YciS (DUF1049 family)
MNFKLIFKSLVILAVLALLVVMGMNNRKTVELSMPYILRHTQYQPAALMYFAFFALGFLIGAILMSGGGSKKSGSSSPSKPSKSQS